MNGEPCGECVMSAIRDWYCYRAGCTGCRARALSRGPDFARCRNHKRQDKAYRDALKRMDLTHQQVLDAHKADYVNMEEMADGA